MNYRCVIVVYNQMSSIWQFVTTLPIFNHMSRLNRLLLLIWVN